MAARNPKIIVKNDQYQSLLAVRTFPVLFAIVCFLVIANTSCDSVGTANVQKFHPNGRYGRRSVNNLAEPLTHVELGKLNNFGDDNPGPLRSILHNNKQFAESSNRYNSDLNDVSEMEQELNKLLRCNYTGVSNLYWCNTNN